MFSWRVQTNRFKYTDPSQRKKVAEAWIKDQAKFCTIAKLLSIRNNRAQWLAQLILLPLMPSLIYS